MPPGIETERVAVAEEFRKNPDLTQEDLNELRQWLRTQKHLPENITDTILIAFHHSCYFDQSRTKETIENFYTMRTNAPEFFTDRDITNPELVQIAQVMNVTRLPVPDPEGYAVYYYGLSDTDPNKWSFEATAKLVFMTHEAHLIEEGTHMGFHMILDLKGAKLRHLIQTSLISLKKSLMFEEKALPLRRMAIHFANAPSWIDKLLFLIKPWLRKETAEYIQCHTSDNMDSLYRCVPKECLPAELGGDLKPVDEYHTANCCSLENFYEYFTEDEKMMKVDESKRAKKASRWGTAKVETAFSGLEID